MKILEDLYYGNISPYNRYIRRSGEVENLLRLAAKNEENLTEGLTEAQKETFEKFKACESEMRSLTELATFISGFKFGAKIIIEVMNAVDEDEESLI